MKKKDLNILITFIFVCVFFIFLDMISGYNSLSAASFVYLFPIYSLAIAIYLNSEKKDENNCVVIKSVNICFLIFAFFYLYIFLCTEVGLEILLFEGILILASALNFINLFQKKEKTEKKDNGKVKYIQLLIIPVIFFIVSFGKEIIMLNSSDFSLNLEQGEKFNQKIKRYAVSKSGCKSYTIKNETINNLPLINNIFKFKGIGEANTTEYKAIISNNKIKIENEDYNLATDYHDKIKEVVKKYLADQNSTKTNLEIYVSKTDDFDYYIIDDEKIHVYKGNKLICKNLQ